MLFNTMLNHKGGVTKTTTAMFLGECLATAGYPALLIDGDPQGTLTVDTYDIDPNAKGLSELLEDPSILRSVIQKTRVENLYVIPPGVELEETFTKWESRKLLRKKTHDLIERIHEELGGSFDAAFVDNTPDIVGFPQYSSELSDRIIMPVESETYALRATVRTWIRIKMSFPEWEKQNVAILIAKHVKERNLAKDHVRAFHQWVENSRIEYEMMNPGKKLGLKVLNAVIPSSADVGNTLSEKSNLFIKRPGSPVAEGYHAALLELFPQFSDISKTIEEKRKEYRDLNQQKFLAAGKRKIKMVTEGAEG